MWQLFKSIFILTPWFHSYSHIQGRKKVVGKNETVATYEGQAMLLHKAYSGIQRGTGTLFDSETDQNVTWPFWEPETAKRELDQGQSKSPTSHLVKEHQLATAPHTYRISGDHKSENSHKLQRSIPKRNSKALRETGE